MKALRITLATLFFGTVSHAMASPFEILVTESFMGSNSNSNLWQGIQRYGFSGTGSSATSLTGISASQVSDPVGLFYNGGELFVGNRHGNSFASSISRFTFDAGTDSFTSNGTITGNGLFGVHGVWVRPGTNDLYAANVNSGLSIFSITSSSATANGTLLSGPMRDVTFSADGANLYATQGVNGTLTRYNFATSSVTNYSISGASGLHFGAWLNDDLYVSDFGTGQVFDVKFDANGAVTGSSVVANVGGAIGVAFSPDQQEMFVSSHTGNKIDRFLYDSGNSSWNYESTIATGTNMGDIQVIPVPEPASFAVLGIGALALMRRRKK
ncbi:MAG: PEP-CTERM sorting domain-containing protein [Armatimonadetes bacterium]|nr:PEP-CTERM sorting domain-containing protein [Armatimonadota bacterium]